MEKKYSYFNNITGWSVFFIATAVYIITGEPTTSFWDCGEFITTAFKLQVGHPPGAPLFMILGRVFSLFAGGDVTSVARTINTLSALASGATILFLFWTITHIAKKIIMKNNELNLGQTIAILGSGIVGSLAYTFSDSFWFSAVEGEVYATSSMFTALVFWAILKWESCSDEKYANRWLIFIAYLMGLSIGIHLLNLLAIPAIVMVIYFKKYKVSVKGVVLTLIISGFALAAIMYGIIPGLVSMSSGFELLFVNSFSMPYNSGVLVYALLLLGSVVLSIWSTLKEETSHLLVSVSFSVAMFFSGITMLGAGIGGGLFFAIIIFLVVFYGAKNQKAILNTIVASVAVIIVGYSSYAMIVIRSSADTPMDQNSPDDVFSLQRYLNREQYGDRPLFYGNYFNTKVIDSEEGKAIYTKKDGKYAKSFSDIKYVYDKDGETIFPRMYSSQSDHVSAYKYWAGIKDAKKKPSFAQNLIFFFRYQVNFMYLRYFLWNFAGRQNDVQGHGEVIHGNWISGINFLDESRLGSQKNMPESLDQNKGRNTYFFLPLILGLLGASYLYLKNKRDFTVVTLLFFFTGLAIVMYLNQTPYQPRERDYAYVGSFYAFAIFIGIGVLAIYDFSKKHLTETGGAIASFVVTLLLVPTIMGAQNWDDHDRSNRYTARDFASNYLESCEKNAIIFTNGDNDTFPLWYAQEVEGIRTDIRVVNLSYLSTDWYIDQMKQKAYESDPVPFSFTKEQYALGKRDYVFVEEKTKDYLDLREVMKFVGSDRPEAQVATQGGMMLNYVPTKNLKISVDSALVIKNGVVKQKDAGQIVKEMKFTLNESYLHKNSLMVLDLLGNNNWKRPVYFAITVGPENFLNLEKYFQLDGLAYRIVPLESDNKDGQIGRVNTEAMYENLMKKFKWGGIDNPKVYLDENNLRMVMNLRNNFARLANELLTEGKKQDAIAVLDRCIQKMPNNIIPYNYYNLLIAEVYLKAGENKKATDILDLLAKSSLMSFKYYTTLDKDKKNFIDRDMEREGAIYQEIGRMYSRFKMDDKAKEVEQNLERMLKMM